MSVLDGVLNLASHGLFPVRLHYPIFKEDRVLCSCGRSDCKAQGKHPVGVQWGKSATDEEEILRDQWGSDRWNVGIILGLCHGIPADRAIIDIEDDTLEGRGLADTLLADYPTPTYTSGKSLHRLYRWSEKLPPVANMTISGLEFRFGGKGKETQSVAPPSVHYTGAEYRWLEGKNLDDLPIAELPSHVVEYLCEQYTRTNTASPAGRSANEARKFRAPIGKIGPGNRHHSLLTEANRLWRIAFQLHGINGIEEQEVIDQVWKWLEGANYTTCDPPKELQELEVIFQSSQRFMRDEFLKELETKEEMTAPAEDSEKDSFGAYLRDTKIRLQCDTRYATTDTSADRIDEWRADWQITFITKEEDDQVELTIAGIEKPILLDSYDFDRPTLFARRVQQETKGKIALDKTFPLWDWKSIWEGRPNDKKRQNGITRGLKEYLTSTAKVVEREQSDLNMQIEDVLVALAGPKDALIEKYKASKETGLMKHIGRLKFAPGTSDLTTHTLPEDPSTGYYPTENAVVLAVKFDELSRRYRSSFGGTVTNKQLAEAVEKLGIIGGRHCFGGSRSRWFVREEEKL